MRQQATVRISNFGLRIETMKRFWIERHSRFSFKSAFRNLKFGTLMGAMLFALCSSAAAQQPKKVPRIGYLSSSDPATESARSEAIRLALRERGYIEGQNIAMEYRYAEGKQDRWPALAAELVSLKVDLIVVTGGAI
jgi:putative tryptophan/tyrosine transport system substrate-binding protein